MKRLTYLCLISIIFFISCGTATKIVFDNAIPAEETATISPSAYFCIISFNNVNVSWGMGTHGTEITIPSGENQLIVTLAGASHGNYTYTGGRFGFSFDFKPGHFYVIGIGAISNDEVTILINDRTSRSRERVIARTVIIVN
jgi:hypothetical protein